MIENLPDWLSVPIGAVTALGSALLALWARSRSERATTGSVLVEPPRVSITPRGPALLLAAHNRELQIALESPEFRLELRRNMVLESALQVAIEEEAASLAEMDEDQLAHFLASTPEARRSWPWGKIRDKLAGGAKDVAAKVLGMINGFIKSQLGLGGD